MVKKPHLDINKVILLTVIINKIQEFCIYFFQINGLVSY